MDKPKQLTFPWSKPNKSSLDEFYFDEANHELKKILDTDDDTFLYGIKKLERLISYKLYVINMLILTK